MSKPPEPEGGRGGHSEVTVTLLANSGKPWTDGVFEQNGRKYRIGKDGSVKFVPNGGEKYVNGHAVTNIINSQIQKNVSQIVLQHDARKGTIDLAEKVKEAQRARLNAFKQ